MRPDHDPAAWAAGTGPDAHEGALPRAGRLPRSRRRRVAQQALADALALARLQADVLARPGEADRAGDDEAVLRCHAELDHVMARSSGADQVRTGVRAATAAGSDLACSGRGAAAGPACGKPRLPGCRCAHCGWQADDPAARAERKRAEALTAAASAVERAIPLVGHTPARSLSLRPVARPSRCRRAHRGTGGRRRWAPHSISSPLILARRAARQCPAVSVQVPRRHRNLQPMLRHPPARSGGGMSCWRWARCCSRWPAAGRARCSRCTTTGTPPLSYPRRRRARPAQVPWEPARWPGSGRPR
jgi:hypothetical protein